MALQFDLVVIGSGPGGYVAAIRASQLGLKVGVIERESLGGICLNWGCIPTKALLKTAQVYEYLQHAQDYGLTVGEAGFDFEAVIKRSRGVADGMSKGINFLFKKNKIETVVGTGKLLAPGQVEVTKPDGTKETVVAKNIILATGTRARQLPNLPIDDKKIIGYRKAMTPDALPKRMVVVGSGAIGVEFAYFYRTMGTEVTIVEYLPRIVPVEDEEVSRQMEKSYRKLGINILTSAEVTKVDTSGEGCQVFIKTAKGEQQVACDVVLSAVGVQTNLENLGLEELGIKVEKGRVLVDNFYQTNVPGIFAIGDIVPGPALAHVASAEGIICVEKIAGHHPEPLNYQNIPGCTYAQPEIASVGFTEAEAKAKGYDIRVGKFPFSASGKAAASGAKDGFVKVIFDKKYGEWLGAHMIGANVTELIAEVVVARKLETTGHEIIKSVHPHPTMSEAIMEATAAAYDEVIHL